MLGIIRKQFISISTINFIIVKNIYGNIVDCIVSLVVITLLVVMLVVIIGFIVNWSFVCVFSTGTILLTLFPNFEALFDTYGQDTKFNHLKQKVKFSGIYFQNDSPDGIYAISS